MTAFLLLSFLLFAGVPSQQTPPIPSAPAAQPSPGDPVVAARAALAKGDLPGAEHLLQRDLATTPANADAAYLLGYVLFREHRETDSLAAYTAAARLRRPGPDDLLVVASDYILLKDYADAEHWLLAVVQTVPGNARAWYLLGRTQYNLDRNADARHAFQQCLALDPKNIRAETNLGLAEERLGLVPDAMATYRRAIADAGPVGRRAAQAELDLGKLLLAQGDPQAALPFLQAAAALAPANPFAQQQLASAFEQLHRDSDAEAALRRAITLAPEVGSLHFFLGRVLHRLGKEAEAKQEFATASRLIGSHSSAETPNPDQPDD